MNENHVISFTKEELKLVHRALLTIRGDHAVLRSALRTVETALAAEPTRKEVWPRDWPMDLRDIEIIGAKR